jgi:predicted nucleotidyltransferase
MVRGLDLFRNYFKEYTDKYILIGGTACDLAMESMGLNFRATKDLDIVLILEALDVEFVNAFWSFIKEGQ